MKFSEIHLNFSEFIYVSVKFSGISLKLLWSNFFHWISLKHNWNFTKIHHNFSSHWNFIQNFNEISVNFSEIALTIFSRVGLIINYEKSDLVPAQVFTFKGMEFLTHIKIVKVPQTGQMKILDSVRKFSQKTSVSARDFLSLLGQLNAAADLVMLGRIHLGPLQMSLHNQWKPQKFPVCHRRSVWQRKFCNISNGGFRKIVITRGFPWR